MLQLYNLSSIAHSKTVSVIKLKFEAQPGTTWC